jgi:transposase
VIVQGTSVGLDVHALSIVAHAIDEDTGKIARARLCPDHREVLGWLHQLRGPVRVTYEAGPTGFGLARAINNSAGMECLVAAPSKLQRPAGDRIKTDARDAAHLARLLRLGEITAVRVPAPEIEAVRDLVRARDDARADLMRVQHRFSKLLLRQGIVYSGGTPWTCVHEPWLRKQRFADHHVKAAFDHSFDAVLATTAARDRLDERILDVAASARFADPVNRLGCLRGISALTVLAFAQRCSLVWISSTRCFRCSDRHCDRPVADQDDQCPFGIGFAANELLLKMPRFGGCSRHQGHRPRARRVAAQCIWRSSAVGHPADSSKSDPRD